MGQNILLHLELSWQKLFFYMLLLCFSKIKIT